MAKYRFVQNGPGGVIAVEDDVEKFAEEVSENAGTREMFRKHWRRHPNGRISLAPSEADPYAVPTPK